MAGNMTQHGHIRAVVAGVGGAINAAAAVYVALATAEPAGPGTATLAVFAGNELTTTGYARQAVSWGAPGTAGTINNVSALTYSFTDNPPEVTHCFACDTSTGTSGTVLAYWTLATALNASPSDEIRFAATDLEMVVS
jgi:hypothetical protein